jgi:CubicO group peptidase (beta-lactamase class C family)
MIRDGGVSLDGARVLESGWVDDIFDGGPDSTEAFAVGEHSKAMPGGKYRSQFWFLSDDPDTAYCLGIHGQMVYINRRSGVVGVKFSSTALPVDPIAGTAAVAMFEAISERLTRFPQR